MSTWLNPSIRRRLTGWYTAVLALMLVVYASVTFVAVRHEFLEQFDDQLQDDLKAVQTRLNRTGDGRSGWSDTGEGDSDSERSVEVWSATGTAIHRDPTTPALPPLMQEPIPEGRYESIVVNGHSWRVLTARAMLGGNPVAVRISRSEERLRTQLWEILVVLVFGLPVIVALAGIGGYIMARRALAPIDHLASEAQRITAERLHERLTVPNPHDEIGRLTTVINDTFARLEASFEQLRRFTADASHELRTPLAVIRGIGEVGLGETRTPAEYKEAMGSMLEEVDRLTHLVDTLLRLSRADARTIRLSPEPVDVGALTEEVVTSLMLLAEERHQRVQVSTADRAMVSVDRLVLREAITNVVDNAVKYSPAGSSIDVRVRTDGDQAVIEVADQGPGIAPEDRARVFDRFFRLDQARSRDTGGTGLGLAIAKWAVEANLGNIAVEPGRHGGSIFRIILPLGMRPANDRSHRGAREGGDAGSAETSQIV